MTDDDITTHTTVWPRRLRVVCGVCGVQLTAGIDPSTFGRCAQCVQREADDNRSILADIQRSYQ